MLKKTILKTFETWKPQSVIDSKPQFYPLNDHVQALGATTAWRNRIEIMLNDNEIISKWNDKLAGSLDNSNIIFQFDDDVEIDTPTSSHCGSVFWLIGQAFSENTTPTASSYLVHMPSRICIKLEIYGTGNLVVYYPASASTSTTVTTLNDSSNKHTLRWVYQAFSNIVTSNLCWVNWLWVHSENFIHETWNWSWFSFPIIWSMRSYRTLFYRHLPANPVNFLAAIDPTQHPIYTPSSVQSCGRMGTQPVWKHYFCYYRCR